jgi:hypothetical protein
MPKSSYFDQKTVLKLHNLKIAKFVLKCVTRSTFNINNGFVDAIVRGLRSGFLTEDDYRRLASSENLDDMRVALEVASVKFHVNFG